MIKNNFEVSLHGGWASPYLSIHFKSVIKIIKGLELCKETSQAFVIPFYDLFVSSQASRFKLGKFLKFLKITKKSPLFFFCFFLSFKLSFFIDNFWRCYHKSNLCSYLKKKAIRDLYWKTCLRRIYSSLCSIHVIFVFQTQRLKNIISLLSRLY